MPKLLISHRHHYVPQFYLKVWQASDGKGFWLYSRDIKGNIRRCRRSSKSVAFEIDLYSLYPETPYPELEPRQDAIEVEFFSKIDDAAAQIHRKILASGINILSEEDRVIWALFLNSLMERTPNKIKEIENSYNIEEAKKEIIHILENTEFASQINWHAMHSNSIRRALVNYISDNSSIGHIYRMRWATVDIPVEDEHLITSDTPIVVNGGKKSQPIHCLSIALSPNKLFITHGATDEFDNDFLKMLTVTHNAFIIQLAEQYVISSRELSDGPYTNYTNLIKTLGDGLVSE